MICQNFKNSKQNNWKHKRLNKSPGMLMRKR